MTGLNAAPRVLGEREDLDQLLQEQVAAGEQASPASDVWSLGATLFHALAGHPPYEVGDTGAPVNRGRAEQQGIAGVVGERHGRTLRPIGRRSILDLTFAARGESNFVVQTVANSGWR